MFFLDLKSFVPALLVLVTSCGGGGSGGGSGPFSLADTPQVAVAGRILTVSKAGVFSTGVRVPLLWMREGTADMLQIGTAIGVSDSQAFFIAPELPDGRYSVLFDFMIFQGVLVVDLQPPPAVADVEAEIDHVQAILDAGLLDAEAAVADIGDPELARALAEDLELARQAQRTLVEDLASASEEEREVFARWIVANRPWLENREELGSDGEGGHLDEQAAFRRGSNDIVRGTLLILLGIRSVIAALNAVPSSGLAAGVLLALGAPTIVIGFHHVIRGMGVSLVVRVGSFVFSFSGGTALQRIGELQLLSDEHVPIAFAGIAESLARGQASDPQFAAVIAKVDEVVHALNRLPAPAAEWIRTRFAGVEETGRNRELVPLDPARVTISSSNPEITAEVDSFGDLVVFSFSSVTETTVLTFQYQSTLESGLGNATADVACEVQPSPCASVDPERPLTAEPAPSLPGGLVIDFEHEQAPLETLFSSMRLGETVLPEFHVDLFVDPPFLGPPEGFALMPKSNFIPTFDCVGSPTTAGLVFNGVDGFILVPRRPISGFGGYFQSGPVNGSPITLVATDCRGRQWTKDIVVRTCTCDDDERFAPCPEEAWIGFVFDAPVTRITVLHATDFFFRSVAFDDLTFVPWE